MTDERDPSISGAGVGALLRAVDDVRTDVRELRDDVREDNAALEQRVMAALAVAREEQRLSVEAHAKAHLESAIENETELGRIRDFMKNAELAQAHRDGALGVFRFGLEQLSRHSGSIVRVLLAAGSVIALASGAIQFEIVIQ